MSRKSHLADQTKRTPSPTRPHEPTKPPLRDQPRPPGAAPRSPVPTGIEQQAQKLIHAAGSPEEAKGAVDGAAQREQVPEFREDHFAQRWGFNSRCELLQASTPFTGSDGTEWWATKLLDGRWIVWNREQMSSKTAFDSRDDATHSVEAPAAVPPADLSARFGQFPEAFNG